MNRTVAIHQPNYLPWLGYFYKIWAADVFVFHDDVQYSKQSLTKRTHIRANHHSSEKKYLSIPLAQHSDSSLISDLKINHSTTWHLQHLRQLKALYQKSPFFDIYFPTIETWLLAAPDYTHLAEWNIGLIKNISALFEKNKTVFYQSSQLPLTELHLKGNDYNLALVQYTSGTHYLSGIGARKYQEEGIFEKANVTIHYNHIGAYIEEKKYIQQQGAWLGGLSILDAIFNIGMVEIENLFLQYFQKK